MWCLGTDRGRDHMALIKCPECGKKISTKAYKCPNCGCPASEFRDPDEVEEMPEDQRPQMFNCYQCGRPLPVAIDECIYCGKKYTKNSYNTNICPKCSSHNIKIRNNSNVKFQCNDCGFVWNEEIQDGKSPQKAIVIVVVIIVLILLFILGLYMAVADTNSNESSQSLNKTAVNAEPAYNSIDDFEYEIKDNKISLNSYQGDDELLVINNVYTIDGIEYTTSLLDFSLFSSSKVETVILAEGITDLNTGAFNCSDVRSVYFPKTMTVMYDYTLSYFHPDEGEKIQLYYGGTEEEWNNIFTHYTTMQEKDSTSEAVGQATADFINGLVGSEYDSSLFEFHFTAKPSDLTMSLHQ